MQRNDGAAVAGGQFKSVVARMLQAGDLGWKLHSLNYGDLR